MRRKLFAAAAVLLVSGLGVTTSAAPASADSLQFVSAGAVQNGTSIGAFGTFTVKKPLVVQSTEISKAAVQSLGAFGGNSVEVGWRVDPGLFGDRLPHLYVGHSVHSIVQCPDACGFRQFDANLRPGAVLTVDSVHQFEIEQFQGNWWIGDGPTWIGFFPNSLFNNEFVQAGSTQWMGTVLVDGSLSCTEMGNGKFASDSTAATITNVGYFAGPAVSISTVAQDPNRYSAAVFNGSSLRFGGPGACGNPI